VIAEFTMWRVHASAAAMPPQWRPGNDVTLPREAGKTWQRWRMTVTPSSVASALQRDRARLDCVNSHRDGRVCVRKTSLRAGRFATSLPGIALMADHA
jgi:hypothetical protein